MVPIRAVHREAPARNSMIGLVLVTHGRLAIEFRSALEHVVGPQRQIEAVTIGPDDDVEQCRKDIIEAVRRVDGEDGVVILTDNPRLIALALKTAVEAAVGALKTFRLIFPERFTIMGMDDEIEEIVGGLNAIFRV